MVLSRKQVNSHDAENQPEDETDQQHIHDGGDGAHQGIHHHLHWKGEVAECREEVQARALFWFPGGEWHCVACYDYGNIMFPLEHYLFISLNTKSPAQVDLARSLS